MSEGEHNKPRNRLRISVERAPKEGDPSHEMFISILSGPAGTWRDTHADRSALEQYLEGVQAGASMAGAYLPLPVVPG